MHALLPIGRTDGSRADTEFGTSDEAHSSCSVQVADPFQGHTFEVLSYGAEYCAEYFCHTTNKLLVKGNLIHRLFL